MKKMVCICAIIITAACASRDPLRPVASSNTYYCDNNEQIILSLGHKGERAGVTFRGRNMALERVESDLAKNVFANSIFQLYVDDEAKLVALEKDGIPIYTNCRPDL